MRDHNFLLYLALALSTSCIEKEEQGVFGGVTDSGSGPGPMTPIMETTSTGTGETTGTTGTTGAPPSVTSGVDPTTSTSSTTTTTTETTGPAETSTGADASTGAADAETEGLSCDFNADCPATAPFCADDECHDGSEGDP